MLISVTTFVCKTEIEFGLICGFLNVDRDVIIYLFW